MVCALLCRTEVATSATQASPSRYSTRLGLCMSGSPLRRSLDVPLGSPWAFLGHSLRHLSEGVVGTPFLGSLDREASRLRRLAEGCNRQIGVNHAAIIKGA